MQTYLKNGYVVSMNQTDNVFDGGGVSTNESGDSHRGRPHRGGRQSGSEAVESGC